MKTFKQICWWGSQYEENKIEGSFYKFVFTDCIINLRCTVYHYYIFSKIEFSYK